MESISDYNRMISSLESGSHSKAPMIRHLADEELGMSRRESFYADSDDTEAVDLVDRPRSSESIRNAAQMTLAQNPKIHFLALSKGVAAKAKGGCSPPADMYLQKSVASNHANAYSVQYFFNSQDGLSRLVSRDGHLFLPPVGSSSACLSIS